MDRPDSSSASFSAKTENALGAAEIRQLREWRVPKAEPLPLMLGDFLTLPDRIGQRPR
jgi:hypothetical protein